MAKRPVIKAEKRSVFGHKVKQLRREGRLPANVFGKKTASVALTLNAAEFMPVFTGAGETTLLDLSIDGEAKPRPVLVVSAQRHPVTGAVLHVDLHQVSLTEKVTAHIPVEAVGESPAVKNSGAVLVVALSEVEVEALPTDLPEKIEVDIARLANFGDSILVKDLGIDTSKITVMSSAEETVLTVQEPKEEEVVEAPPAEAAPVEGEAAPAAEAPAEEPAK